MIQFGKQKHANIDRFLSRTQIFPEQSKKVKTPLIFLKEIKLHKSYRILNTYQVKQGA